MKYNRMADVLVDPHLADVGFFEEREGDGHRQIPVDEASGALCGDPRVSLCRPADA